MKATHTHEARTAAAVKAWATRRATAHKAAKAARALAAARTTAAHKAWATRRAALAY